MLKQVYLIVYNATGFFLALHLLIVFLPEVTGMTDPLVNTYCKKDS